MRYFFVFTIYTGFFTLYLKLSLQAASFRSMVTDSFYDVLPEGTLKAILEGEFVGTLLAVIVVGFLSLGTTWSCYLITRLILKRSWVDTLNHSQSYGRPNSNGLVQTNDKIELMVTFNIPATGLPRSVLDIFPASENIYHLGEKQRLVNKKAELKNPNSQREIEKGYNFNNLMPLSYIRVDKETLEFKTEPKDALEALYRAGLEMLYKHKEWPAAVGQNHAGARLLEHSVRTGVNLEKLSKGHPCASVAGLFHDIGKILAYEKKGSGFKRLTKNHDSLSLNILINLPEFQVLPEKDRNLVRDLVMYGHSDLEPVRLIDNKEFNELKRLMSYADGSAVQTEIEMATDSVTSTSRFDELVKVVWLAIASANINNHLSLGIAAGFCNDKTEIVFIPITNLLREMLKHASPALSESLMLEVDYHQLKARDFSPTLQALRHLNLLVEDYHGLDTQSGLYVFKSSSQKFSASVLLNKAKIFESDPALEGKWGATKYTLSVMKADEK